MAHNYAVFSPNERGQAILIVVLVMVLALTIGLAVVAKSITNVRTTRDEEDSVRAFSAAEAGVEQALKQTGAGTLSNPSLSNGSGFTAQITLVSGQDFVLNAGNSVTANDGSDIWLSTYSSDPSLIYTNPNPNPYSPINLTFYWGTTSDQCTISASTNTMAAVEIIVLSGSKSNPVTNRYSYDPCSNASPARNSVNGGNHFTPVSLNSTSIGGKTFAYQATIPTITNGLIVRVMPLYANTPIAVHGDVALPSQGTKIDSTGTSGEAARKITVYQAYPGLPTEFFPYIYFSPR